EEDDKEFLTIGKQALKEALKVAKEGNYIYDISLVIQDCIKGAGYSIIQELTGHGVGRSLHEDPFIPGYVSGKRKRTPQIKIGMVLALEVIYSRSSSQIVLESDGWSYRTKDKSLAACFEHSIAISDNGPLILT
ncbi:MAG: M24 family metallopeptidase, partial [Candidatus Roizmanbacteria bacterium]